MVTPDAPLRRHRNAFSNFGIIPSATIPSFLSLSNNPGSISGMTLPSSSLSLSTPFFSKHTTSSAPRAAATDEATVSAFVLSSFPFPSWLIALSTGTSPIPQNDSSSSVFTLAAVTSPTAPKSTICPSTSIGGLLVAQMTFPSQPESPIALQPKLCSRATTFLLHSPAYTPVTTFSVSVSVTLRP